MNWNELFKMQEVLDNKIHQEKGLSREETFEKRILALLVEVGEMLNEWQGFKYWKENNEPKIFVPNADDECEVCFGNPVEIKEGKITSFCDNCDGVGVHFHNPLLEEHVDDLHFILSLGNDLGISDLKYQEPTKKKDLVGQVLDLYDMISVFRILSGEKQKDHYHKVFSQFIRIGQQMGFTMEQVYEAYKSKNEINFKRLSEGY